MFFCFNITIRTIMILLTLIFLHVFYILPFIKPIFTKSQSKKTYLQIQYIADSYSILLYKTSIYLENIFCRLFGGIRRTDILLQRTGLNIFFDIYNSNIFVNKNHI